MYTELGSQPGDMTIPTLFQHLQTLLPRKVEKKQAFFHPVLEIVSEDAVAGADLFQDPFEIWQWPELAR